eukprot:g27754.t1
MQGYRDWVASDGVGCSSKDVDILQRLGLIGKKSQTLASPSSTTSRSVPQGVIPFKLGVILTQRARIKAPVAAVIPTSYGTNLTLVLSLCSHRVNNAFLFTVRNKKKKLQLGVQFIPGKIIVYVGHKQSVYFDYDVHDGQWHDMAISIRSRKVTLYTSCGKNRTHANLHFKKEDSLDPEGSFLLGKLDQHSVQFEGAVCQFDIYPSAKAAHNYCKYIKKQCRQADIYRPNLLPLLPILPRFPNSSTPSPSQLMLRKRSGPDGSYGESVALMGPAPTSPNLHPWTVSRPAFGTAAPPTAFPTRRRLPPHATSRAAVPTPVRSAGRNGTGSDSRQGPISEAPSGAATQQDSKGRETPTGNATARLTETVPAVKKTKHQPAKTQRPTSKEGVGKETEPKPATTPSYPRVTYNVVVVTPAATDGYQTFGMESFTVDPMLQGLQGIKGDPGPM